MLDSLRSLKELLFPLSCLGCATADYWLCPTCQSNWQVSTRKTLIGSNPLYFKADYSVKTSAVILAAKKVTTIWQETYLLGAFHNQLFMLWRI